MFLGHDSKRTGALGGIMSRLPAVIRDELSPEHQKVWDRIAAVRGGVPAGAGGPFGVLMHLPATTAWSDYS